MLKRFLLLFSLLLFQNISFSQVDSASEKHVLMVYSKNPDLENLKEFTAGFSSYISNNRIDACMIPLYLDKHSKRSYTHKRDLLVAYIRHAIPRNEVDLIVATDLESHFLLLSVDSLLPKALPVVSVYMAGNHVKKSTPRFSTFEINSGIEKNFLLGMELFPKTKEVLYISDTSQYGKLGRANAKNVLGKYSGRVTIKYISPTKKSYEECFKQIDSLNHYSFIILSSWYLDQRGYYRIDGTYHPFISRIANVPIIGINTMYVGTGILCGYLASMRKAGYKVAADAVKIMYNPAIRYSTSIDAFDLTFDYRAMKKWGIAESGLPKNATFINRPHSIFNDYKAEINFIIAIIALLSLSLIIFALYHLRYMKLYKENLNLSKENASRKELLDNTLSVMSEGVVSFDTDLNIININTAARQMSGTAEDPVGRNFESVFTTTQPEGEESIKDLLLNTLIKKERVIIPRHTRLDYKDSESRVISGNISPVIDADNNVSQIVLVFRDVTESHKQKRFLSIAVESAKSYTWFFNTYNGLFAFGENYQKIFGYDYPNQTSMDQFLTKVHPNDREKLQHSHEDIISKNITDFSVEYRISFSNDNHYEWWERRGVIYSNSLMENEIKYVYGMDINIDAHKEREAELLKAKLRAEESDKLKSAFLSNMSHEIRTPLNGIVGFSNLLTDPAYSKNEKDEFVRVINSSSKILMNLISDILDLSRIESNTMNFEFMPVNLSAQIQEISDSYKLTASDNTPIVTNLPEKSAIVNIDPFRNRQVITNLINNSLKFTEQGEVRIGYSVKDNFVEVYVSDDGKGIEKDHLQDIFQRFYKVDEFKAGTGLGLPICRAIVERSGGKIWAESEIGKGTVIRYTICLSPSEPNVKNDPSQEDTTMTASSPEKGAMEIKETKRQILIAEDIDSNYQLLYVLLSKDFDLLWARNGEETIEMFKQNNPSMILMDVKMPVMDGLEATRIIRRISPTVPIIAQTANAFEADRKTALEAGCNDIITKPIKSSILRFAINKYLTNN